MFTKLTVIIIAQHQCHVTARVTLNLCRAIRSLRFNKPGEGSVHYARYTGRVAKINNALLLSESFCPCGDGC